jgi:hypothetical protein
MNNRCTVHLDDLHFAITALLRRCISVNSFGDCPVSSLSFATEASNPTTEQRHIWLPSTVSKMSYSRSIQAIPSWCPSWPAIRLVEERVEATNSLTPIMGMASHFRVTRYLWMILEKWKTRKSTEDCQKEHTLRRSDCVFSGCTMSSARRSNTELGMRMAP